MTATGNDGLDARPGEPERVVEAWFANRTQGWRAVGGRLTLTTHRLMFAPHGFDAALGGQTWQCHLGQITGLERSRRTWHPFNGGLRRRLQVDALTGEPERFVVWRVDRVAERIRQQLPH